MSPGLEAELLGHPASACPLLPGLTKATASAQPDAHSHYAVPSCGPTWPIQVAKDANIRRFAIRKVHSGEKTKSIATQTSAEEIRCVTDGSTQPSEQNPGTEMDDQGTVCGGPTWALLEAQTVKNLPAVQETQVRSLGWEDPLEKGMATHSSILAWRIPWSEEPGGLYSP